MKIFKYKSLVNIWIVQLFAAYIILIKSKYLIFVFF